MMKKVRDIIKQKETLRFAMKIVRNSTYGYNSMSATGNIFEEELDLKKEIDELKADLE